MQPITYFAPQEKFTIIPNDLLHDSNLSDGAKVLAFYLMSLPKGWQILWENVAKALNAGVSTIKRRKNELVKLGYLISYDGREKGKFKQPLLAFKYISKENLIALDNVKEGLKSSVKNKANADEIAEVIAAQKTARGEMDCIIRKIDNNTENNKDDLKSQEQEIFVIQKTTAFFKTFLEANAKAVLNYKKAYNLEDFLSGAELAKAKEWVAWRNQMWHIKPIVSVEKLRRAKERGCDVLADLERCMANDWRGYFSLKDSKSSHLSKLRKERKIEKNRAENDEIYTCLRAQGWDFSKGDSYKNMQVNGRAINRENGLFYYV